MLMIRPPVWEIAVHLAVAGDVFDGFDGVFLCCSFPRDVLDDIWDLMSQFLSVFLPTLTFSFLLLHIINILNGNKNLRVFVS